MRTSYSIEDFMPEMRRMREEGMSNASIAESLGICLTSVIRHLGPQPKELRRKPVYGGKPKPYREPEKEVKEEAPACLVVVDREIVLKGTVCQYDISPKSKKVDILFADGSSKEFDFEKFKVFVDEVNAIKRHMDDLKLDNEMW